MQPSPTLLSWARQHFAQTDLGDARRTRRLVNTAARLAQSPSASLPRAHEGLAEVTGAYRFLNNDAVDPQDILGGHRKLTNQVAATHDVVLCVQDTTTLDFTGRECKGLGETGNGLTQGLLQHAGLAVTEDGQPLGVMNCFWHKRVKPPKGEKRNQRSKRPTEAEFWKDTAEAIGHFDAARLLHVGDRLADVFEFMQDALKLDHGFVIRAKHNRKVDDSTLKMREKLQLQPSSATREVEVPRDGNRRARTAKLCVRWAEVELPCPKYGSDDPTPIRVWAAELHEPDPPEGEEALNWLLLTSEPVEDEDAAWLAVARYKRRWVIEEWHKAIKSGFKLESAQLKSADGLRRLGAIAAVVSLRLMQLRDAAASVERGEPPAADSVFVCPLADPLWRRVLAAQAEVPEEEVDAALLFRTLAMLGGHLGRKHDPRPGWSCLWYGYRRLSLMVEGVRCVER